jgi:hypothetical protein
MGDTNCTALLSEATARLAELRNDVHGIAETRAFPLFVETVLISTLLSVPLNIISPDSEQLCFVSSLHSPRV